MPAAAAERLLTYAFAAEVIEEVALEPVRGSSTDWFWSGSAGSDRHDRGDHRATRGSRAVSMSRLARLPISTTVRGQAPRLPRQRRHEPEAAPGDRGGLASSTLRPTPTSIVACTFSASARRWPTKASANGSRASSGASAPTRSSSPAAPRNRSTWWRRASAGHVLGPGDEILVTGMEHHSNIVPWQLLCRGHRRDGCGQYRSPTPVSWTSMRSTASSARTHGSSPSRTCRTSLGTVNPVAELVTRARPRGRSRWWTEPSRFPTSRSMSRPSAVTSSPAPATRSTVRPVSGCSTAGAELLERMPPWQGGGRHDHQRHPRALLVRAAARASSRRERLPIAEVVGLGAALDYLEAVGIEEVGRVGGRAAGVRGRDGLGGTGRPDHREPRRSGWASSRSSWKASIPTT